MMSNKISVDINILTMIGAVLCERCEGQYEL